MKLTRLNFSEHAGTVTQWEFDNFCVRERNLVVGVNASGKTRILKAIDFLAQLLSKRAQPTSFVGRLNWQAEFADEKGSAYSYKLEINDRAVTSESFAKNGDILLERVPGKTAQIWSNQESKKLDFQTDVGDLAAVAKRDGIQTPFLDSLYQWGQSVYHYPFGTSLGQDMYGLSSSGQVMINVEQLEHDPKAAIFKFNIGSSKFSANFMQTLKSDMTQLHYSIEDAILAPPSISGPVGLLGLVVKESDLDCAVEQSVMSQGMFRAFSLLMQVNYLIQEHKLRCLLIDDIGEGLDYDRSCAIIDVLSGKSKEFDFQLIMATNDRFIMNHVPLEDWTLIRRRKGRADIHNYANSKAHFDEFKFTGLSNFDFLTMNFVEQKIETQKGEDVPHEKAGGVR